MNIEEPDIPAAIGRNGDLLGYAHVADSPPRRARDRQFRPRRLFPRASGGGAMPAISPSRAFSSKVLGPDLVGGVRLWREAWKDSEAVAAPPLT